MDRLQKIVRTEAKCKQNVALKCIWWKRICCGVCVRLFPVNGVEKWKTLGYGSYEKRAEKEMLCE